MSKHLIFKLNASFYASQPELFDEVERFFLTTEIEALLRRFGNETVLSDILFYETANFLEMRKSIPSAIVSPDSKDNNRKVAQSLNRVLSSARALQLDSQKLELVAYMLSQSTKVKSLKQYSIFEDEQPAIGVGTHLYFPNAKTKNILGLQNDVFLIRLGLISGCKECFISLDHVMEFAGGVLHYFLNDERDASSLKTQYNRKADLKLQVVQSMPHDYTMLGGPEYLEGQKVIPHLSALIRHLVGKRAELEEKRTQENDDRVEMFKTRSSAVFTEEMEELVRRYLGRDSNKE